MISENPKVNHANQGLLRIICALVLAGILVAGLWPFHSPNNQVSWIGNGAGLFLGKYGILVSAQPFRPSESEGQTPCTLEVWLEPARLNKSSGTIFAYYRPDNFEVQISLRQYHSSLVFGRGDLNYQQRVGFVGVFVADVLHKHRPVLLSITTGESGTAAYADGTLVTRSSSFKFSGDDLTGQLMFGNAPATTDFWSGTLKGFALYDRELSAAEIKQHYVSWVHNDETGLTGKAKPVEVYLFNEDAGSMVRNQVDPTTNLLIPDRFFVPHKKFLEAAWDEFDPGWTYWESVAINVVGFIPLGFFFCALFYLESKIGHPVRATILLGFIVSLTIEVLQGFLPTRASGTTDLLTNTLGTALGAVVSTTPVVRYWVGRVARWPSI